MDKTNAALLNLIQKDFPLHSRPYRVLAEQLHTTEEEIIARIKMLKAEGYIKKIGATFDSKKLGFKSTLCAISVPESHLDAVAQIINAYKGVTHNYIRKHRYNMWFTLTAPSLEALEETLCEMREKTGISEILNLSAKKVFKIDVNFRMSAEDRAGAQGAEEQEHGRTG